jgi:hypothetical protein
MTVATSDVDHARRHRRRGTHLVPSCKAPALGAAGSVEGVEVAIITANVDGVIHDRGTGINQRSGADLPLLGTCGRIEGVNRPSTPNVDDAIRYGWTGKDRGGGRDMP